MGTRESAPRCLSLNYSGGSVAPRPRQRVEGQFFLPTRLMESRRSVCWLAVCCSPPHARLYFVLALLFAGCSSFILALSKWKEYISLSWSSPGGTPCVEASCCLRSSLQKGTGSHKFVINVRSRVRPVCPLLLNVIDVSVVRIMSGLAYTCW